MDSTTQEVVNRTGTTTRRYFPRHGWAGLLLIGVFWPANWLLEGARTAYAFFPLWLGYSLVMDALAYRRNGTSLLTRNWKAYAALFVIASPGWWLFEAINLRVNNWEYLGRELFNPLQYVLLATLNFSIVMPAVFGAAEWFAGMAWIQRMRRGPIIRKDRLTTTIFFVTGWIMLALMLLWPRVFFPFVWLSVYFILEPVNVWLGNRSLGDSTQRRDWRPVISLFAGACSPVSSGRCGIIFPTRSGCITYRASIICASSRCRCWATGVTCRFRSSFTRCIFSCSGCLGKGVRATFCRSLPDRCSGL